MHILTIKGYETNYRSCTWEKIILINVLRIYEYMSWGAMLDSEEDVQLSRGAIFGKNNLRFLIELLALFGIYFGVRMTIQSCLNIMQIKTRFMRSWWYYFLSHKSAVVDKLSVLTSLRSLPSKHISAYLQVIGRDIEFFRGLLMQDMNMDVYITKIRVPGCQFSWMFYFVSFVLSFGLSNLASFKVISPRFRSSVYLEGENTIMCLIC